MLGRFLVAILGVWKFNVFFSHVMAIKAIFITVTIDIPTNVKQLIGIAAITALMGIAAIVVIKATAIIGIKDCTTIRATTEY